MYIREIYSSVETHTTASRKTRLKHLRTANASLDTVAWLYESFMKNNTDSIRISRIVIIIHDIRSRRSKAIRESFLKSGSRDWYIEWRARYCELHSNDVVARRRAALIAIHSACVYAATTVGIDPGPFMQAYKNSLEAGLCVKGLWKNGKRWKNPTRPLWATVSYSLSDRDSSIDVNITDRGGNIIATEPLARDSGGSFGLALRLGRFEWIGPSRVCLHGKRGRPPIRRTIHKVANVKGRNLTA